jgi:L-threonylcarbamoyladenylate synthase
MHIIDLQHTSTEKVIEATTAVLAAGGLVIFPTETVYGAGVDATNQAAVDKLLAYKSRREGKPLSVAVTSQAMAEQYVELNEQAKTLYKQFLPGPVTVVSKGRGKLAQGVESEFGTVGVRIPAYPLLLELLNHYQKPITATSANGSGKKRPYSIQDIFDELSEKQKGLIDLVLDAGVLPKNEPSTVIDTSHSAPVVMRAGAISGGFDAATRLSSASEQETKTIAGKLLLKRWNDVTRSGLIIGLDGELGTGKTVFTKGLAEFLKIDSPITSPTYSYLNEYSYQRHEVNGTLYHLDLWKIESAEELSRLELINLATPNNVIIIEWWSQVSQWLTDLPTPVVNVLLTDTGEQTRSIAISESSL